MKRRELLLAEHTAACMTRNTRGGAILSRGAIILLLLLDLVGETRCYCWTLRVLEDTAAAADGTYISYIRAVRFDLTLSLMYVPDAS